MKNIFIFLLCSIFLTGCNKDKALSKKVPGWYSYNQAIEKGTIVGKLTYYKNGALKLEANVKGELVQNVKIGITLTASGTWKVENGFLKEEILVCKTTPQFIGDALLSEYKKAAQSSPGDKIIEINKNHLRVKKPKGEIFTYKRIQI